MQSDVSRFFIETMIEDGGSVPLSVLRSSAGVYLSGGCSPPRTQRIMEDSIGRKWNTDSRLDNANERCGASVTQVGW
jgi:hypothetical protein